MAEVLMIAYSCEPGSTSEGQVGWELASRLARRHRVTLLTRPNARDEIDGLRSGDPSMDLEVEYHELGMLRKLKRLRLPVSNLRYLVWNHRLGARVEELEQTGRFDLVHHTTWVRHWMPPAAAASRRLPFVWGPVGAAERTPAGLLRTVGWAGAAGELARLVAPRLLRLDPMMKRAIDRVEMAVASSFDTARYFEREGIDHTLAPSVGYEPREVPAPEPPRNEIVSVGRLLGWKGFHLGLQAFARLDQPDLRYVIIGDGPARRRLEQLARKLGVSPRVEFTGRLGRDDALRRIGTSRVLVHPSFHDSGGFVVVEALARGVPVMSLDIGGPPFLAGQGGRAVPARPVDDLVGRLTKTLSEMLTEGGAMSEAARGRAVEALTWDRIVDVYDGIYQRVTEDTG